MEATAHSSAVDARDTHGEELVSDFLVFRASDTERRNFEQLMDLLHAFHQRVSPAMTAHKQQPGGARQGTSGIESIENGVRIALGAKLRVSVQFSVE